MSNEQRQTLYTQIGIWRRNLNELEKQRAQHGIDVPVSLINSIEQAREEIKNLEQRLASFDNDDPDIDAIIDQNIRSIVAMIRMIEERMRRLEHEQTLMRGNLTAVQRKVYISMRSQVSAGVFWAIVIIVGAVWAALWDRLIFFPAQSILASVLLILLGMFIRWLGEDD